MKKIFITFFISITFLLISWKYNEVKFDDPNKDKLLIELLKYVLEKGHYQSQIRARLGKFLSDFDIQDRIKAHQDAGADHVCLQPVDAGGNLGRLDWACLEALAT